VIALLDGLLDLWQEPVDQRADPEAAFRELYADPVSINGVPDAGHRPGRAGTFFAAQLRRPDGRDRRPGGDSGQARDRLVCAAGASARCSFQSARVAPTGCPVEIRTIDVLTIADDLITALWVVSDELGTLTNSTPSYSSKSGTGRSTFPLAGSAWS
jgi:hypothetical protein